MAHSRRDFLKYSAMASASLLVPDFLKAFGNSPRTVGNGKILVVIQLSGGNDGLNCIVPFRNDLYYKARPDLGIKQEDLIKLTDEVGLNSNLKALAQLFSDGQLAIINNVGYPNPNRSHFRSTDIWQSASDEQTILNTGWIGRYLDSTCNGTCVKPHTAIELDDTLSLALKGERMKGIAFRNPDILHISSKNNMIRGTAAGYQKETDHTAVEYLHKTLAETTQSADYIYEHSKIYRTTQIYPNHQFGKRMKTIAELICSGSETLVYYVSLPGFDTHALQKGIHSSNLKKYSDTLSAFCADLKAANRFNDTVILTFSEFGRRVAQNGSKGTDHGTANNVYIAGGKLATAGIINALPDLQNLDNGDLIHTVDFRRVYATLLDKVLNISPEKILGQKFEPMNFI